jgi:hypothetical protein
MVEFNSLIVQNCTLTKYTTGICFSLLHLKYKPNHWPLHVKGSSTFNGDVKLVQPELGWGKTLWFGTATTNTDPFILGRYNTAADQSELRLFLGDDGGDRLKHLPEVPSAKEVEKNGLELGDNQALLLKKIEELTLYLIDQNNKLEEQNKRIRKLEAANEQLRLKK